MLIFFKTHRLAISNGVKLGLLLFFVVFTASASAYNSPLTTNKVLSLINQDRRDHGLNSLELSPTLNLAASAKAYDMLAQNYFSHIGPDGSKPWRWFKNLGYNYIYAGENLAAGYTNAEELENSLMLSEKHRANILFPYYSEMGIAIVNTENTTIVVQFFGSQENKVSLTD
jgi:uncharacterized protein YkwD